jgi:hypothetical protein
MRAAHVADGSLAHVVARNALLFKDLRDVLKAANAWQP